MTLPSHNSQLTSEPFLSWEATTPRRTFVYSSVFISLVRMIKTNFQFDEILEAKAVDFLKHYQEEIFEASKSTLFSNTFGSNDDPASSFFDCILVFVTCSMRSVAEMGFEVLTEAVCHAIQQNGIRLIRLNIIPRILNIFQPFAHTLSSWIDNHTRLLSLIRASLRRFYSVQTLNHSDDLMKMIVRDMIFDKVAVPSSQYLDFLSQNSVYHQQAMDFVLSSRIPLILSNATSFLETDTSVDDYLFYVGLTPDPWDDTPADIPRRKRLKRELKTEGLCDTVEQSQNSTQTHSPSNPKPESTDTKPSSSPPSIFPLLTSHYLQDFDVSLSPLSQNRRLTKLSDHVDETIKTRQPIPWNTLMNWFVEGVIGLDSRLKLHPYHFPLTEDDVMIDDTGTIRINPSQLSPPSPLIPVTQIFSVDLLVIVSEWTREHTKNVVMSLFNSFIQSGDITPTIPLDQLSILVDNTITLDVFLSNFEWTLPDEGWTFFCRILADVDSSCDQRGPSAIFDKNGGPSERSKRMMKTDPHSCHTPSSLAEMKAKARFFEILVEILDNLAQNATDISVLRDSAFKETLVRLQSKYQTRILPKSDPLHSDPSSQDKALPSTTRDDQINPQFKQTPDDESIETQEVRSGFQSLHPSTRRSVQSDDSHSTSVNSDQSTSASITLQTELPPSEDTDPLSIESASIVTHSLFSRLHSATESNEAMAILKLLHSLIVAPPIDRPVTDHIIPPERFNRRPLMPDKTFDVNERFSVSIFDENDENLFKSLIRLFHVCQMVPPDQCIEDIPSFLDMLISSLTSNISEITRVTSVILIKILQEEKYYHNFLQKHWNDLRTAYRDGSRGTRQTLVCVIAMWLNNTHGMQSTHPNMLQSIDLDEVVSADIGPFESIIPIISFLNILISHYSKFYTHKYIKSLLLSFEAKQHASARIWKELNDGTVGHDDEFIQTLVIFCLNQSLLFSLPLQPAVFDYILHFTDLHSAFIETNIHPSFLLSHSSMSLRPLNQQAVLIQLLFERTLRSDPSVFFSVDCSRNKDQFSEHLQTPFVGLHSLFVRGFHPQPFHVNPQSLMLSIHHFLADSGDFLSDQFHLFALFPPPPVLQFFSTSIVQSPPDEIIPSLMWEFLFPFLATCGPFGECRTLSSLVSCLINSLSVHELEQNIQLLIDTIIGLHWFSLPLSFSSPFLLLPHHHLRLPDITPTINPWTIPSGWGDELILISTDTTTTLKDQVIHVSRLAFTLGLRYPVLKVSSASGYSRCGLTTRLCRLLISPIPSVVSLVLAFLTRLVHLSDEEGKMVMIQLGVIDCVVVAVSQSSFLEDYENGIALIGDLLRTVRQDEQSRRMIAFDFVHIL
ncbi:hypothetical protein BLNAU_22487 [Blattamonas nauphoetae]|uniref:Uncharacterized protein n=1 Tax=Blattamonas nauphoetae TaxID=2049346 RepID=A0ABQ9WSX0_9EUKA|nr:hypothetical protein BLNAU_22487 [Blattamonas nauphoetae]